LVLPPFILT